MTEALCTRHPEAEALPSTHNPGLLGLNPVPSGSLYTVVLPYAELSLHQ